jgi:putative SOS response-associated peptidase YedK
VSLHKIMGGTSCRHHPLNGIAHSALSSTPSPSAKPNLYEWYNLIRTSAIPNLQPRFNICPTTTIDTVISRDGNHELIPMRWGLVPSWWKKPLKELKLATFNARVETVAEKPFF